MGHDKRQIEEIASVDDRRDGWPVPTRMMSNGEFLPHCGFLRNKSTGRDA